MDVSEFLNSLGLRDLCDVFKEQCIDMETLSELTHEELKLLVPKLGIRHKIRKGLNDLKNKIQLEKSLSEASTVILSELDVDSDLSDQKYTTFSTDEGTIELITTDCINNSVDVSACGSSCVQTDAIDDATSNTKHDEPSSSKIVKKNCTRQLFPNNQNLKQYLKNSTKGKAIMKIYETNNCFNPEDRRQLVNLIIHGYLECYDNAYGGALQQIAEDICDIFPTESIFTYYYVNRAASKNPKGKLYDKLRNEKSYRNKVKEQLTPIDSESERDNAGVPQKVSSEEMSKQKWLSHCSEPWVTVVKYWTDTFAVRSKSYNPQYDLCQILKEWPIIKNPNGYALIDIDFELKFPKSSRKLYDTWEKTCQFLTKEIAQKETIPSFKDNEDRNLFILRSLPKLFGYGPSKKKKQKISKAEAQDGFICTVKDVKELSTAKEKLRDMCLEQNCTAQPQLYYQEDTNVYYFSLLDTLEYKFDNIIQALDAAFKFHLVLNLFYSKEASQSYTYIQQGIFQIFTEFDVVTPTLAVLLKDSESLLREQV